MFMRRWRSLESIRETSMIRVFDMGGDPMSKTRRGGLLPACEPVAVVTGTESTLRRLIVASLDAARQVGSACECGVLMLDAVPEGSVATGMTWLPGLFNATVRQVPGPCPTNGCQRTTSEPDGGSGGGDRKSSVATDRIGGVALCRLRGCADCRGHVLRRRRMRSPLLPRA